MRRGVDKSHILYLNFESFEWMGVTDAKALYAYIGNVVKDAKGKYYILLDEMQEVEQWEKAVNSFMVD